MRYEQTYVKIILTLGAFEEADALNDDTRRASNRQIPRLYLEHEELRLYLNDRARLDLYDYILFRLHAIARHFYESA